MDRSADAVGDDRGYVGAGGKAEDGSYASDSGVSRSGRTYVPARSRPDCVLEDDPILTAAIDVVMQARLYRAWHEQSV